ncbi:MAG: J domain-containing protein [Rhodospirillales bacterium]|nr:J domain-containing protein [Rhodospirillales bacterium]
MARANKKAFNGYSPRYTGAEATRERVCDWPGCDEQGEHRAPKSRTHLNEFSFFCLDHIRQFNKSWNYYEGMSEGDIEKEIRKDTIGRRPTWPFGARSAAFRFARGQFGDADTFGLFDDEDDTDGQSAGSRQWAPGSPEESAMVVLDLTAPVTVEDVKTRYKKLVKRHHPDANGGDKAAEERFKQINLAYHTIMQSLSP